MNAIIISSFPQDWNVDPSSLLRWISDTASSFMAFVSQPRTYLGVPVEKRGNRTNRVDERLIDVYIVIAAFVLTFTAFYTFILALGFGPVGIGAGKLLPPTNLRKAESVHLQKEIG